MLPWCKDISRCIGQCLSTTSNSNSHGNNNNNNNQLQQNNNFYQPCGGMMPAGPGGGSKSCPSSARCISDPRILGGCGVACDGAGICVPKKAKQCGGFQGLECPKGQQCFDEPTDSCDPASGGADCTGICLVPLPKTPTLPTPTPPTAATAATSASPTIGKIIRRHGRARLA